MWETRNQAVQEWEQAQGITAAKELVRERVWQAKPRAQKRERQRKPIEEIPQHRQRAVMRQRRREEMLAAGLTEAQACTALQKEFPRASSSAARLQTYTGPRILTSVAVW